MAGLPVGERDVLFEVFNSDLEQSLHVVEVVEGVGLIGQ